MSQEVIELSVEETNRLRADLGLAPLRVSPNQHQHQHLQHQRVEQVGGGGVTKQEEPASGDQEEVLELSVDDTNKLREKLGLPPLRSNSSKREDVHKPAENDRAITEVAERIAQARLKREVELGGAKTFGESTLADDAGNSALSWAEQMRRKSKEPKATDKSKSTTKNKHSTSGGNEAYDEKDLEGIQVAHTLNDLEAGATTVLTLADAPLLSQSLDDKTSKRMVNLNEGDVALENVNLTEIKKQQDGLRKKRLLEMGMGRAGGYAGFDDEEFEELGGTLGPAKRDRGNALLGDPMNEDGDSRPSRGFRIGGSQDANGESPLTDFDKIQSGNAISLVPVKADLAASDYMTLEEEEAERASRKKKKDGKFKKEKKKKDKKRRKTKVDSDEEEQDEGALPSESNSNGAKSNLLEQLEETALPTASGLRKRRRGDDDDDEKVSPPAKKGFVSVKEEANRPTVEKTSKMAKYDEIMAKGNERTQKAFGEKTKSKRLEESYHDEEPDDSFLNAALAKARRLNRLRDMNKPAKGADAVAESVKSMSKGHANGGESVATSGGISFTIDDTREFTLALQAREQQKEREAGKAKQQRASAKANQLVKKLKEDVVAAPTKEEESTEVVVQTAEEEDVDMEELAKEVKTDHMDDGGFEGSTARSSGVGRGLSSFVSMLKTTGEISKKAGKEELKGRAKDERNYDIYAPVDLSQVVKIGRNANDKDRELANREIKLEYRDKDGRLLTTKEAYRDLCYQFHGHGASKKKEEKRMKQIEREQAQARLASRSLAAARDGTAAGTLGALKATQKATGKAFIVHKTS